MSTSGTTSASSAHADETGLTSPLPPSPARMSAIASGLQAPAKQALSTKGKRQVAETKPPPPKWLQDRQSKSTSYTSNEIISIGNMPSNAQLKSMKSKPGISIRWKAKEGDEPVVLYESFPKALAITFSGIYRESNGSSVVIVGGIRLRIKKIFEFVLEAAKGQGCPPSPIPEKLRYCTYFRNECDASWVHVPLLETEYAARRAIIESVQVHSGDIGEIYRDKDSKGSKACESATRSVAKKWASKELMAFSVYKKLREELPEFDADTKKALREFQKPMEEERQKSIWQERQRIWEERQQAQKQAWTQQSKEARQAQAVRCEKAAVGFRSGSVPQAQIPPARNLQSKTVEWIQTTVGRIWVDTSIYKNTRSKAPKGHKKADTAKKAIKVNKSAAEDVNDKTSKSSWAGRMADVSGRSARPPEKSELKESRHE